MIRAASALLRTVLAAALLPGCSTQAGVNSSISPTLTPSLEASATPAPSPAASPSAVATPAAKASVCGDPTAHVYHPYRLQLRVRCLTVTGTVAAVRSEADGDYHILLRLDPPYANLINNANVSGEHGDLVLEPVCELPVTQQDAIASCAGVSPTIVAPAVGTHVSATGTYVLDADHGWMELHPLWEIHPAG